MSSEHSRKPFLVLGIGNILLSDEGIGVRVIERMQTVPIPEHVEIVDGGTSGVDLLDILADRDAVIVVDAVDTDCRPGTVLRFGIDQLMQTENPYISMHEVGIAETILMTEQLGCTPKEVIVFGIQPEKIECGLELSKTLAQAVQEVVELVLNEISRLESTMDAIN